MRARIHPHVLSYTYLSMYGRFYTFEMFWRELEGREVLGIGFVLLVTTSFVPRCSTLRLLDSVIAGHSAHFFCMRLKFTISTRPTLYLYFRKQEVYRISAIKRRGYYLFHHAIYCGYYSRAATDRRWRLLNSKRGNGLEHRVCTDCTTVMTHLKGADHSLYSITC